MRAPPCVARDRAVATRGARSAGREDRAAGRVAEHGPAFVVGLVGAIATAEHRARDATDQRALARGLPAVGDGSAGSAEAGAKQTTDRTRLRDAPDAIAGGVAISG